MSYTTREISKKLRRYADLLESERHRASMLFDLVNTDATSETMKALEFEIGDVMAMANYLWEAKESI